MSGTRIVKDAKERRKEILDVAQSMFIAEGYDNVSTNDIIARIGIARGTLYYHFASKEEILDGIIDQTLEEIDNKIKAVVMDESMPVLERFTQAILCANVDNELGELIKEQVHNPRNALMHQKTQERLVVLMVPYLVKIIKDGISAGIMQAEYPDELIEMTVIYANTVFDDFYEYTPEEKTRKVKAFIHHAELMLHMEEGSLLETMIPMFYRR